jgi:hypothetical protein
VAGGLLNQAVNLSCRRASRVWGSVASFRLLWHETLSQRDLTLSQVGEHCVDVKIVLSRELFARTVHFSDDRVFQDGYAPMKPRIFSPRV